MVLKLIKFNTWFAFACGIFALLVAPLAVEHSLIALGVRPGNIFPDAGFLLATSYLRIVGILLLAFSLLAQIVLKGNFSTENLRPFFAFYSVGILVWGGAFFFLIFTRSPITASLAGFGLLEWLLIAVVLLFTYKSGDSWKAVPPKDTQ